MTAPHNFILWLFAGLVLLVILAACSPLATPTQGTTPTAAPATATPAPLSPTPTADTCTVTAGHLNLRTGAGNQFPVIKVLTQGETLIVINPGEWLNVTDATGAQGFIYSQYCGKGK